jgi:hypothetical protein
VAAHSARVGGDDRENDRAAHWLIDGPGSRDAVTAI